MNLETLSIRAIAALIKKDWKNVYFGAVPYLDAMFYLDTIEDSFGEDPGKEVVLYFLANAQTWKGEVARAVKKELNKRIK